MFEYGRYETQDMWVATGCQRHVVGYRVFKDEKGGEAMRDYLSQQDGGSSGTLTWK